MSPGTALLSALQEGSFASAMRDSIWLYPLIVPTGTLMFASDLVCDVNAQLRWPKALPRHHPAMQSCRHCSADELRRNECRRIRRPNAGEGIRQRACKGHRRVGE